jgi:hypothetical protein
MKYLVRKNTSLLIACTSYTNMSDSVYLYQSVSLSPSSQSVPSTAPHYLLTSPSSTAIPQCIIVSPIHCNGQTALLNILITSGELWCHAFCDPHWLNYTFMFLGLKNYLNTWRSTIFFTGGVSSVTNFKYLCSAILCCVYSLISLSSRLVLRFLIFGLLQVLFLSLAVHFSFFNSNFTVTPPGLDPFSGASFNEFTVSVVPSDWE